MLELLRLADSLYPDEVDLLEDALAAEIGLVRHPGTPQDAWRKIRVQVEAAGLPDDYLPKSFRA